MSLRRKVFFRAITLIILLVVGTGASYAVFAVRHHRKEIIGILKLEVRTRARESDRLMLWDDRVALNKILRALVHSIAVCRYAFIEKEGRPYAHTFDRGIPRALLDRPGPARDMVSIWKFRDRAGAVMFDMAAGIGEGSAVLHIGLSQDKMDLEVRSLLVVIIVLCLAALIIGTILTTVFTRWTTTEVDRLTGDLRISEEKFTKAFHESPVWVVLSSLEEDRYIDVNETFLRTTGYQREEVVGRTSMELDSWVDPDERRQIIREIKEKGSVRNVEVRSRMKSGEMLFMLFSGEVIEIGGEAFVLSVSVDISDRKRSEQELEYQKRHLESLIRHSGLSIVTLDERHHIVSCNRHFETLFQFQESEILGRNLDEVIAGKEFMEDAISHTKKTLRGEAIHGAGKRYRKDGTLVDVEFFGVPVIIHDEVVGAYGIYRDISHRKAVEESLAFEREQLLSIFESINEVIYVADPQTYEILFANRTLRDAFQKELVGGICYREFQGLEAPCDFCTNEIIMRDKGKPYEWEYHNPNLDQDFWITDRIIRWPDGRNVRFELAFNITERKKTEEALRESEERYRTLVESSSDAILMLDIKRKIVSCNQAFLDLFGYERSEVEGHSIRLIHQSDESFRSFGETAYPVIERQGFYRTEWEFMRKQGAIISTENVTSAIKEPDGSIRGHVAVIRDITERKKLESQLQQAQKLESVGTLAGGIAHDFNNILSPIMIHSEMVMMDLPSGSPLQQNMKQIYKAGERARDLVKQILTFARRQEKERVPLRVSRILKEAIKLLRSTIPTTIDIQYDIKSEQDTVLADPTQMNQIIMNLCTNAAHAMEDNGGTLEVILTNENLDSESANEFHDLEPGRYVKLSVRDTGHGIEPQFMDKIFEPYFTTKEVGKGTGMGLALVHGIVKSYGGAVTVQSEVGKGTSFHVYLPLVEGDMDVLETAKDSVQLPTGTERILFVDDEKAAVDVIQSMLEKLGYKVTARTSSIEALEAFRNNPQGFDLVITDMTMPNMTGKELAKELMVIRSDIPIILCTGFSEKIDERRAEEMGISAFVMKPIVMRQIANTIREVLDQEKGD